VALGESSGDVGQVTKETDLRTSPSATASSLGRLPKGTIVTQKGDRKDRFYRVEVELEDGVVEGWVAEDALTEASRGEDEDDAGKEKRSAPEDPAEKDRPSSRLRVPKDEGLLLRREQTFSYGLHVTPDFCILETDIDTDLYTGFGYTAGAFVGIFLSPSLAAHVEANYAMVQGVGDTKGQLLQFGFFEVNGQIRYLIERFELAGGVQYSIGLSLNDVPPELGLTGAIDMSSLYGIASVGYRIPMNEMMTFVVRARYAISFLRAPVAIQKAGVDLALEFGG
jgi:hypothetical protein